jgi:hypothetical protein
MAHTRELWLRYLERMADLPLRHAAEGTLARSISGPRARDASAPLEMMGRILAGIGPWLDGTGGSSAETALRGRCQENIAQALSLGCDPAHEGFWGFGQDQQSLVDAAFLSQFVVRAPKFCAALPTVTRQRMRDGLLRVRPLLPHFNNWLLFSAAVEAALQCLGEAPERVRVDYALRQHEQWYLGDAHYSDGPAFHADYYNSFVIQPLMLDVLETFAGSHDLWDKLLGDLRVRLRRYAAVLERMIAADGSWPPIGRSIVYRCGAFHALSTAAWKGLLPPELPPAQVRCALGAALTRSLDAPGTWKSDGWMSIGLCGEQPALGESYIGTASVYLASFVFPALGLPETDPFWAAADLPWTQVRLWQLSENLPADHALYDQARL